eukprot:1152587-Pelagomonas_calceolata.AAC.1
MQKRDNFRPEIAPSGRVPSAYALFKGYKGKIPQARHLRYVLEGSADQQRQREELGKIALSPPPGRGMAGVAADLGVDLGHLSQQGGGKVVILNLGSAK